LKSYRPEKGIEPGLQIKSYPVPVKNTKTGWISETFWLTWYFPLFSSEAKQALYAERILASAETLRRERPGSFLGFTYISLIDPSGINRARSPISQHEESNCAAFATM